MHLRGNTLRAAVVAALAVAANASLGDRLPDFKECIKVRIDHLRQKLFRAWAMTHPIFAFAPERQKEQGRTSQ
ncbi:hypothetical protein E4T52_03570 [Aureobasidium sp. EXF-3400]|nr:hypothetical protein E4T51_02697 [Aureobasidium sp. EXF-12344]KAI4781492.1 hypothetical protein E4T52_03570 [Aureobasidium sp. EXF-3400]